jgi:Domain of unknown function (DUF4188)
MIHKDRMTARIEGDFVVFLIGMRFNQPWKIHKWLPVFLAMPKMYQELYGKPELGFFHHETWIGRTIISVQYWRSIEQLIAYAKSKESEHLPAWKQFNNAIGKDGTVGIWHETYVVAKGCYENIYINMPPFGFGKVGTLEKVHGKRESAEDRLKT